MANRARDRRGRAASSEYLSDTQLRKLVQTVNDKADVARRKGSTRAVVNELLILLLVDAGLRASELCNLNIVDLPIGHGENTIWVRDGLGNVARAVDVTPKNARYLDRFVRLYRNGARPNDPVVTNEHGKRLAYSSLYSKVKNIGKSADIGSLHPQMLRRTYIVRLYNVERDLRFVQTQAGHASPRTTALYAKADEEGRKPDAGAVGNSHSANGHWMGNNRWPTARRGTASGVNDHGDNGSCNSPRPIRVCEACGRSLSEKTGTRIDSGQILCGECLRQLRMR
jgi:integrase